MTYFFETYGCEMNIAESASVEQILISRGWKKAENAQLADLVVINTCSVRGSAEERIFGRLGFFSGLKKVRSCAPDAKKRNMEIAAEYVQKNGAVPLTLIVMGCMAERLLKSLQKQWPCVDYVVGTFAKNKFGEIIQAVEEGQKYIQTDEEPVYVFAETSYEEGAFSTFVPIMHGCNNFCSYCIVPYVRGRERSREPEKIIAECRELIAQGYKEITLLGQNVNSYGKDLDTPYDFADLLAAIDAIPGEYWIRFMSSQPKDATHKLFDTMARCWHVCKQLHLPVQSGNDRVLRAMNRPYSRAGYLSLIGYARSVMPGLVLTSDVIIGFPGETESEAMDTVSLVEEAKFDALFTFIFSPRPGTPAAGMADPVPREEKQKWFDRLVAVQNAYSAEKHASYIGKTVRVLVDGESDDPDWPLSCRTEGNRLVRVRGDKALIGTFADVTIQNSNTWALYGEAVK